MEGIGKVLAWVAGVLLVIAGIVWFVGSENPTTPAGYMGYLTKGAVFGKTTFVGIQRGPTSPGREWLLNVTNVSITPYTYDEQFVDKESVLSKDNLQISFTVHIVWKIRDTDDDIKTFVERYSILGQGTNPDQVARIAYNNNVREPLRTFARDEVQLRKGLDVKNEITTIGDAIKTRVDVLVKDTPFEIGTIVVGNIQYPKEVAQAVAEKLAATQLLEQQDTQTAIKKKGAEQRIAEANGIAEATRIINGQLTPMYLQHEAIEAQKAMVNSPNHTTTYIPVGPMGVPIVGTMNLAGRSHQPAAAGAK